MGLSVKQAELLAKSPSPFRCQVSDIKRRGALVKFLRRLGFEWRAILVAVLLAHSANYIASDMKSLVDFTRESSTTRPATPHPDEVVSPKEALPPSSGAGTGAAAGKPQDQGAAAPTEAAQGKNASVPRFWLIRSLTPS